MVAVLDVISSLEKYPITKEALEETRLGKLINDVRKKTQNEELAKRAKRLLRSWQKLIEPVAQAEAALRGLAGAGSANGGHHCRPDAAARGLHELKSRLDPPRLPAPRADRPSGRKRRGDPRDLGPPGPAPKLPKAEPAVPSPSPLPTNGVAGSPEPGDCDRPGGAKIPVNAVRPHAGPPGPAPLDRVDARAPPPPRCSFGPRNSRLEGPCARRRSPYAPKGSAPSPSPRPPSLDASRVPSPLPPPSTPLPRPPDPEPSESRWPEPPVGHPRLAGPPPRPRLLPDAASPGPGADSRRRKRSRPRDYTVNLDGQAAEAAAGLKPVRLKERKLTFDPMTRQIRPLAQKEPAPGGPPPTTPAAADRDTAPEPPRAEAAQHSPLEQTNWKELSSNGLIQTYLSLRSSLLASGAGAGAGAGAAGLHLRPEQHARPAHVLLPPPSPPAALPGLGREVSDADVARLQAAEWPGVNGCRDTRGAWFDWTQCIPLDPHGDEGRLNILPYVCLD